MQSIASIENVKMPERKLEKRRITMKRPFAVSIEKHHIDAN